MPTKNQKPKPKAGRPRLTAAQLATRGSRLTNKRAAEAIKPAKRPKPSQPPKWKAPSAKQLAALILGIPGYDPHRDADGCWFDCKSARDVLRFFETELRHVEGSAAGKPFILSDWQRAIVANLFGWKRKDDQGRTVRRFREALIYIPRKNGKTPLAAGICLFCLFEDGEPGAQIVSAAADRNQAALLFRHARGMTTQSPRLAARGQIFGGVGQRSIVLRDDAAASFQSISADAFSKHGLNLSAAVVDELHAQPNRDLCDTLQTSMASANRAQPLMLFITTADFARPSICNEKHEYACKVRDGIIVDPAFLPVIYEAPAAADWTDPQVWTDCNPNIDVTVSREYLTRECQRAQETPTYENTFRRLHLDQKTETDIRWLAMDRWDSAASVDPIAWRAEALLKLGGLSCTGGLDLSTTIDLTAFVLAFRRDGQLILLPYFWAPRVNAEKRERRDRVPYVTWARQGFLTLTSGDTVDYDVVRRDIAALGQRFDIRSIARDRWNASQITNQLMGDGFNVVDFGQGFASMSAPCKEFETLLIGHKIEHGGNPVLRWMASNVAVETDAAGNIKPSKKKSTERIDGIVAGIMALGVSLAKVPRGKCFYDDHEVEMC